MLDFTTIDFETANDFRGSPCSVGLVKVRGGVVVDERHWLMRPPKLVDRFSPFNVSIHGITAEMVTGAPRWHEILPAIIEFIGGDVVIAHNAAFDISVMRYACAIDNIEWPEMQFLCTLVLARRAFALPSYRLPFVTNACGFVLESHHNAIADAHAVVSVVNALAASALTDDLTALAASHDVRIGHMTSGIYRGSVCTATGNAKLIAAEANPNADPDGYLYGRVVVFTGKLMAMTRQLAWDAVVHAGGVPEKNTNKRTNVVVLGDFNPASLRPGATFSAKARRAFQLQDKGQDIELMTEADFLQVLEGNDPTDVDLDALLDERPVVTTLPTAVAELLPLGHIEQRDLTPPDDRDAYWAWHDEVLLHPDGRAVGGEPCVRCGAPVPANSHWVHRDRHVCGERCNHSLNRWLNRRIAKRAAFASDDT